ncbi:glycine cleavage system protein R [Ornithinimicrobium cryptoxanthini]|uniref:ACT domain-containing protein n=1 Tax=Ornithinimicrobium cryptoxanthini TaxID=2934161 RepID=A0ABY4YKI7_9MICO|nr:ACT domain-containing protein [Ornithinimicrobium cryptoxanthini]USQ77321.1 ACT domain-containing protein [Ornithinimicrobium cryptoxanthini]
MRKLVVSVIADERPGLVAELASAVAEHGGNWLESQMGRLGGKFAGAVLIEVAPDRVDDLTAALKGLSDVGVVDVSATSADGATKGSVESVRLQVVGQDQPGIVREVTRALAAHGLSIQELYTETSDAPMTGDRLFEAAAAVELGDGLDLPGLRAALDAVSADLSLDIQVDDGHDGPAWGEVPDSAETR